MLDFVVIISLCSSVFIGGLSSIFFIITDTSGFIHILGFLDIFLLLFLLNFEVFLISFPTPNWVAWKFCVLFLLVLSFQLLRNNLKMYKSKVSVKNSSV
jgi:hypothetical protein